MELTKDFKKTEAGEIPTSWVVKNLNELSEIKTGPFGTLLKASEYVEYNGVPLISVGEIRDGFFRVTDHTPRIPERVSRRLPQYVLKKGDIVFGRKGGIDRSALVRDEESGWFLGSDGLAARPKSDIHHKYLSLQLLSHRVRSWLLQNSIGTTMPSMNQEILGRVAVPLPPNRQEQEAIANALSDADAHIESLEKLIAKKRLIKKGVMQDLFSGKMRLPSFSGKWQRVPLGGIGQWKGGMTPSMQNPAYWVSGTCPWVSSGDVKVKRLFSTAQSITELAVKQRATNVVPAGSILIVMRSGILRKFLPVSMNAVPMAINQDIKAIVPMRGVSGDFILHALTAFGDDILARCLKSGTTVESIELGWLKAFEIPFPELKEQQEISNTLTALDEEIDGLDARLQKARFLKQGMMQELLTGRIRLV